MIIRFTDDYVDEVNAGYTLLGQIQAFLCAKEPFMGNSKALDHLYALSFLILGIIDHLEHDDNTEPADNEMLLMCLRKLINKEICGPVHPPVMDVRNYHNTSPHPAQEKVHYQSSIKFK